MEKFITSIIKVDKFTIHLQFIFDLSTELQILQKY